jgi:two-component system, cell cycle sensor histidine kinase and response regulator CckA
MSESKVARRILLVDDDEQVRTFATRALERAGYDVVAAHDGTEALRISRSLDRLDVLVTDVVMPSMMGGAVARTISTLFPTAEVVLMSGLVDDATVIDHVASGRWGFLSKPFTASELEEVVSEGADEL